MRLFFDEEINSIGFNILDESEATHISKVLRLKQGEIIYITNGKGKLFEAEIIDTKPSKFTINVLSVEHKHQNHKHFLHIAIAPTKNMSRFEWFVEKAVELGVDRITPLLCRYSERKKIKIERLNRIVISAMKQSLKFNMPQIDDITSIENFIQNTKNIEGKYISLCNAQTKAADLKLFRQNIFLVGPEGGFSDKEISLALSNGFKPLKISDYRLRTETAGVVICSFTNFFLGF